MCLCTRSSKRREFTSTPKEQNKKSESEIKKSKKEKSEGRKKSSTEVESFAKSELMEKVEEEEEKEIPNRETKNPNWKEEFASQTKGVDVKKKNKSKAKEESKDPETIKEAVEEDEWVLAKKGKNKPK